MADENLLAGDEFLKRSLEIKDSMAEIRNFTREVNNEIRNANESAVDFGATFNSITRSANRVAEVQRKATESAKGTGDALKEQAKQQDNVKKLNVQINDLYERSRKEVDGPLKEALIAQSRNLAEARDNAKVLADTYGQIAQEAAKLDKSSQAFDALGQVIGDIPGLKFFKGAFDGAATAARKIRLEGGSGLDAFTGGVKALGKGLSGQMMSVFGPAGAIFGVVKAIKFFVDLLISANKNTVQIAKDMSITRKSAEGIRQNFIDISASTSLLAVNSEKLIIAQKQLADLAGITNVQSAETLINQVRLTERLGVGAEEAAKFNFAFEAFGQNAEEGLDKVIATENSLREATGTGVNLGQAISEAAKAGGQVLANAKGSMTALAGAALEARRLGLNLEQTKKISSSLLDFESSIQSELEAELLTGKQINLELARQKALQGDIVGASKELVEQVGTYEDFTKLNVLQQNSLAKAIGLTADELADSLLLQTNLKRQGEEYLKVYREQGAAKAKQFADDYGFSQIKREELDKTVAAQQAFEEAMAKTKDQFSGLVSSGVLDNLVNILQDFVKTMTRYGFGREQAINRAQESREGKKKESGIDKEAVDLAVKAVENMPGLMDMVIANLQSVTNPLGGAIRKVQNEQNYLAGMGAQKALSTDGSFKKKEIQAEDFTIRTLPEDTLVGAGGTKLGKGVENKLDTLISVMQSGGNIYLDGNKVGNTLAQNARRL
jgi:hypothetical protein